MEHAISIVIVDDMQFSRAVLRSALNRADYHDIRLAASANDVLHQLDQRHADVILADWVMPEMSGLELTDRIRERDAARYHYSAIILLTAKEGSEPMVEAFRRGVDDYLTKPVRSEELAARVFAASRVVQLQNALLETSEAFAAANQYLTEICTTDILTGIGNRRNLDNHLFSLLKQLSSRGGALSLAILRIGDFSGLNDRYSNDVANEILVGFAHLLKASIRPTDLVVRLNGARFAILVHHINPAELHSGIFERLSRIIRLQALKTSSGDININASIGVCQYQQTEHTDQHHAGDLYQCAEQQLITAEAEEGQNHVAYVELSA